MRPPEYTQKTHTHTERDKRERHEADRQTDGRTDGRTGRQTDRGRDGDGDRDRDTEPRKKKLTCRPGDAFAPRRGRRSLAAP